MQQLQVSEKLRTRASGKEGGKKEEEAVSLDLQEKQGGVGVGNGTFFLPTIVWPYVYEFM